MATEKVKVNESTKSKKGDIGTRKRASASSQNKKTTTTKKNTTKSATKSACTKAKAKTKTATNKKVAAKEEKAKFSAVKDNKVIEKVEINDVKENAKVVPCTIMGVELPTGNTKEDKKERSICYLKDALLFASIVPVIDLFLTIFYEKLNTLNFVNSEIINYVLTMLVDFVLIFIFTFLLDFIIGESKVKRIKK